MRLFIKIATTPKSQRKTESHNLIGCQTFGENASKIIGPPSFSPSGSSMVINLPASA